MVTEGVEPSTVALLAQRSNRLSYATFLPSSFCMPTNILSTLDNVIMISSITENGTKIYYVLSFYGGPLSGFAL